MRVASNGEVSRRAFLHAAAALGATACGGTASTHPSPGAANVNGAHPVSSASSGQPHVNDARSPGKPAKLLAGAEITCAAVHPSEPLLATGSMTPSGEGEGQIVVWDVTSGQPIHAHFDEHGFGFEPDEDMLAWAPVGHRIAVSSGTNAVTVVEDGEIVSTEYPDETRDHAVSFCWLGDDSALYVAAFSDDGAGGAGAIMTLGQSGGLKWLPKGAPARVLARMRYNASIRAVVGDDLTYAFGVDAVRGAMKYQESLAAVLPKPMRRPVVWSHDGRRAAIAAPVTGATYERAAGENVGGTCMVSILDGDTGKTLTQVPVAGEVDALRWSADGRRLAIVAGPTFKDQRQVHVIDRGSVVTAITSTIDAPLSRQSFDLPDARSVDWSPDANRLALLLRDGSVRVVDTSGGRTVSTFSVLQPNADSHAYGLLWANGDRIAVLSKRSVSFWSLDGRAIARHVV